MQIIIEVTSDAPHRPLARLLEIPLGLDVWETKGNRLVLRAEEAAVNRISQMGYQVRPLMEVAQHLETFATAENFAGYHSAESLAAEMRALAQAHPHVAELRTIGHSVERRPILELAQEPTYRVRAFRRAADVVSALTTDELERRISEGSLQQLPGIGTVTALAITEAQRGEAPVYLRRLESTEGRALTAPSPRLTGARGLSAERLRKQLEEVERLTVGLAPFRILTGIEVDINEDGSLDQEDGLLDRLDIVVASVHSKLRMPSEQMTERMITAVANARTDVLGHCTGRIIVGRGRPESDFDAEAVFEACRQFDVAVEINSRPERLDPPKRLLRLAGEAGCRFAIDSDV